MAQKPSKIIPSSAPTYDAFVAAKAGAVVPVAVVLRGKMVVTPEGARKFDRLAHSSLRELTGFVLGRSRKDILVDDRKKSKSKGYSGDAFVGPPLPFDLSPAHSFYASRAAVRALEAQPFVAAVHLLHYPTHKTKKLTSLRDRFIYGAQ